MVIASRVTPTLMYICRAEFEDEDPETLSMRLNLIESLQSKLKSVEKEDGEFEDEDPETLSMRLNLIESLQSKLKSVEKEDGEVSDEDTLSGTQISSLLPKSESSGLSSSRSKPEADLCELYRSLVEAYSSRKRSRKRENSKSRAKRRSVDKRSSIRTIENGKHHSTPRTYLNSGKSTKSTVLVSKSREREHKSRGSSNTYSTHSRRSRKSDRDATKVKNELAGLKQLVPELSITLPVERRSPDSVGVVVTTSKDAHKATTERVVDTSKSANAGENRSIKRVRDSRPHLSITVNGFSGSGEKPDAETRPFIERLQLPEDSHFTQNCSSTSRPSPRISIRNFTSETINADTDIPLPPPPAPPNPIPMPLYGDNDFLILPPPPAPPIFPQTVGMLEKCNPSSITVQVREGGARVAQLSSNTRMSDATTSSYKRLEAGSARHMEEPPLPPPISTEHFPDNYEDVGMDVESSRSSCVSDCEHVDDRGIASPRHRLFSDSDEAQLREMLLNQVTQHRKRLAESTAQSSSASCDGRPEEETQNQPTCSNEEGKKFDVKNVFPQAKSEVNTWNALKDSELYASSTLKDSSNTEENRRNSFEGLPKRRKLDDSGVSEEYYSLRSPPSSSLSSLESMLRENQSQLNELDSQISRRMSLLHSSLLRRTELKKQLAELEADIDAERTGCRLLMQRRNSIRRAVERYEECKLDLLLENEWRLPNGSTENTQKNDDSSPVEETGNASQSGGSSTRPSEENSSQEHVLSHEEEQMRLKLLARIRKDVIAPSQQEREEQGRSTPSGSVEEYCNQSTQTPIREKSAEEMVLPLYRSDSFPERLKRFVGIPPDMSVTTDCPSENSGEKCTDVFCKSYVSRVLQQIAHGKDEELSPDDVLSMMISYAPGLVDSIEDSDLSIVVTVSLLVGFVVKELLSMHLRVKYNRNVTNFRHFITKFLGLLGQVDALKAKRLPHERFGIFARRLLDELPPSKRPTRIGGSLQNNVLVGTKNRNFLKKVE
ncbi:hypothetical protein NECAME_06599 [Necator americanus]|uniref:Uncharacterized protein n=1 Tax=Necator americanus TaxID=51031 RepID=W2TVH0_NECAM|nr:hypothetical protein NECAME_06599 [Necator americanus]ETN85052.1 hypothetical protein NECAME_06599 [Necator americanus]